MWFAVGFAAACALGAYLLFDNALLLIAIGCMILGVAGCFVKNMGIRVTAVILVGVAMGSLWIWGHHTFYLHTAKTLDGETVKAAVEISDYSYPTEFGIAADGKIKLEGKTYKIRVYTAGDLLIPGDVVTGSIELRYTGAGGKRDATYHQGNGIQLLGYVDDDAAVEKPMRFRENISRWSCGRKF